MFYVLGNLQRRYLMTVIAALTALSAVSCGAENSANKCLGKIAIIGPTHMTSLPAEEIREPAKKGKKGKADHG